MHTVPGVRGVRTWVMGWLAAALAVILITLFAVSRVHAQEPDSDSSASAAATTIGRPLVLQGSSLTVLEDSAGSVFAMGSSLRQTARVQGDVAALASSVVIDGEVEEDVYALAGSVVIKGHVHGNVTVLAGSLRIEKEAQIDGSVLVLTESLHVAGTVNGELRAHAKNVVWSGAVRGPAEVSGRRFTLEDSAQTGAVSGSIVTLEKSDAASVSGAFTVETKSAPTHTASRQLSRRLLRSGAIGAALLTFTWFLVQKRWPNWQTELSRAWAPVLLTGGAVGLIWPLLACILVLTFVGIPFAIIGTLIWGAFIWFGWVFPGSMVVQSLSRRFPNWPSWTLALLVGAGCGVFLALPLGWIVRLMLGLGGLGMFCWGCYQAFRLPIRR